MILIELGLDALFAAARQRLMDGLCSTFGGFFIRPPSSPIVPEIVLYGVELIMQLTMLFLFASASYADGRSIHIFIMWTGLEACALFFSGPSFSEAVSRQNMVGRKALFATAVWVISGV